VTKLGRLVKAGKIKSMEEIYLHSLPIKEYQIVDAFLPKLKDEVMKVRDSSHFRRLLTFFRSSPSRSKLAPVSALGSRPSSSSETRRATSAWESRRPRRSPLQSAPPSSLPNSVSFPFVEDTGAAILESRTLSPPSRAASAAVSLSE
jgi:hypothetical protein